MPIPPAFGDLAAEVASTRRMLAAFPDAHAAWKPHDKSRSLAELATHVATIPTLGTNVLTAEFRDVTKRSPAATLSTAAALVDAFNAAVAPMEAALGGASDATLGQTWSIRAGDTVLLAGPRTAMFRTMVMSHLIHHRAQLGVYFRLVDAPVPGMYGPSADEVRPS